MPVEHAGPRRLRQLLDAILLIGSDLDLRATLLRIIEAAVGLVDATYGALGVLDETGTELAEFITVGVDDETHRAIGNLPKGLGLLGSLITNAQPLRLADLREHPDSVGFPPNHPGMSSFLGVPILVHHKVFGNLYLTNKSSAEAFTDIDEELALSLAGAAGIAIENARLFEQVRLREATLTAMHEISTALRLGRADDETLQLVARHACDLVDADLATIVVPEPDSDSLLVHVAVGPLGAGMAGFAFPRETSVSGDVLQSGVAHVIDDARREPRYFQPPSDVGTVGPVVIIPLVSEGRPFGTLSVARSTGSKVFSGAEVDLMQSFAAQAGVVLELERGRQTIQRLDRLEDRERIARDLHDTVIQRLYATGLSLTGALRLIPEGTARQRVGSAIDELDTTIRQIRTVIFEVERPGDAAGVGVRSRVIDLAHEAGRALNFEPRVAFDGTVEASIGRTTAAEMLATLREALSNIARHAAAKSVDVEVAVTGDTLTLRVRDDGVGITAASARTGGHGIANMRSRAERLGGTMTFVSLPDEGTALEWRVPI